MLRSLLGHAAAAALVAASTGLLAPTSTAAAVPARAAAGCSTASGVTVVVDFGQLGGGVTAGCDGNGGGPAAQNFADAGYQLSYSQAPGMNGFVCKVQGKPTDGDCAQTDQFWSLWWSDGKSERWVFSSRGAGSLTVPAGGYVAFAWHQGGGSAQQPGVVPTARAAGDTDDQDPGSGGNGGDRGGSDGDGGSGTGADDSSGDRDGAPGDGDTSESDDPSTGPSATRSDDPADRPGRKRDGAGGKKRDAGRDDSSDAPTPTDDDSTALPEIDEITDGPPPEATADEEGSSFPAWIAVGVAVLVIGAAAAVPILRRRAG